MTLQAKMTRKPLWALLAVFLSAGFASSRARDKAHPFKFVGGTEKLEEGCAGKLEVAPNALVFACSSGSITAPFNSILLMQFRPDLGPKVRKLKLKWKVRPVLEAPLLSNKRNRYFTVLYVGQGETHAMVLDVSAEVMRPYLAEIDLKAGKRVEVKGYEEYE